MRQGDNSMEKLTVSEYAKRNGISIQAVYKKLNRLETVEEVRNGRKVKLIVVDTSGEGRKPLEFQPDSTDTQPDTEPIFNPDLVELNGDTKPNSTDTQPDTEPDTKPTEPLDSTARYIAILEKQLEEKDLQIERLQADAREKDRQLQEQFDRLSALLLRSQELEALAHKSLGEGAKSDTAEQERPEEPIQQEQGQSKEPKRRKWLGRIFRK